MLIATIASPFCVWFIVSQPIEDAVVTWGPVILFAAVFLATVLVGLILAPWLIHKEEKVIWENAKREELAAFERRLEIAEEAKRAAITELNKEVFVYEFGNGASFVYNKRSGGFSLSGGVGGGIIQIDGPRLEKLVQDFPRLRSLLSMARSTGWGHNFTIPPKDA